jgi:FtsH-binding integral membrane protein
MSVIGDHCTFPTENSPGCGCTPATKSEDKKTGRIASGTAITSALAAVACTACCVLPFTLSAVLLASWGGVIAVVDHAHGWVTLAAVLAVVGAWMWIIVQMRRTRRKPARSAMIMMALATALTLAAASWFVTAPAVYQMLGITKIKKAT